MKVLLVEDSQLFSYYLLRGLKKENYTVDLAENGMDGLNLAINNYMDYSIVLLDWNLPDMTGIQVCKYLRKIDTNIPIIFLTGQNNSEDAILAFESGATDFIRKPVAMKELIIRMKHLMPKREYAVGA